MPGGEMKKQAMAVLLLAALLTACGQGLISGKVISKEIVLQSNGGTVHVLQIRDVEKETWIRVNPEVYVSVELGECYDFASYDSRTAFDHVEKCESER